MRVCGRMTQLSRIGLIICVPRTAVQLYRDISCDIGCPGSFCLVSGSRVHSAQTLSGDNIFPLATNELRQSSEIQSRLLSSQKKDQKRNRFNNFYNHCRKRRKKNNIQSLHRQRSRFPAVYSDNRFLERLHIYSVDRK